MTTRSKKIHLLMYTKGDHYLNCATKLKDKCLKNKLVDNVAICTHEQLQSTDFYINNKELIDSHNAGYWVWKPFLIKEYLKNLDGGDYLIYHDGGNEAYKYYKNSFNMDSLEPFLEKISKEYNGILPGIWQNENHKEYCKQDCFHYMECEGDNYRNSKQISASWSVWQKGAQNIDNFLNVQECNKKIILY